MTRQEKLEALANMITAQQQESLHRRNCACQANLDTSHGIIIEGKKYTRIDIGSLDPNSLHRSGRLMIDEAGDIYGIKAYGVIHRGHRYGNLDTISEWWWGEYYPQRIAQQRRA